MPRKLFRILFALSLGLLAACSKGDKSGPVVATGKGFKLTESEVKVRLEQQRATSPEDRKRVLDDLITTELLAGEAEKEGLDQDPELKAWFRQAMVSKLRQKKREDPEMGKSIPDSEIQQFYDTNKTQFIHPKRVTAAQIFFKAAPGPELEKKRTAAKSALLRLQQEEQKKNPAAFATMARDLSEDEASKSRGGDLGSRTQEDYEKLFPKEVVQALFSMKASDLSGVIEGADGLHIFKVSFVLEGSVTTLEQAKSSIARYLGMQKKAKEFDEWVKNLRAQADVKVDQAALEKIAVAAPVRPPMPMASPHGGPLARPMPMQPIPGQPRPVAVPSATPAPPSPTPTVNK